MFAKLDKIKERYDYLTEQVSKAEVIARQEEWKKLVIEHSALQPIVAKYDEWMSASTSLKDTLKCVEHESDKEMAQLMQEEIATLKETVQLCEDALKVLLLPRDPDDDKNVIIEVRSGAGGDEAALFAYEIKRMYQMFADRMRWKIEEIDTNEMELGGIKEAVFTVIGNGAYSWLKYESGVHRVQRVPETENQGRIHTSTITVAVLPEVEDVEISINEADLKIDTYRSSGAGGQHVNKTESAIRITHVPSGIIVACQEERSQVKNRDKAMKMLRAKLYDASKTAQDKALADTRRMQVGTGDRSERIRTYNYPQGRVSDHRINLTLYSLEEFMNGDLFSMIEALRIADQTAKLQSSSNE